MKRIIKDFASLSDDLLLMIREAYPLGVRQSDLVAFPSSNGKKIYVIELMTQDAVYLVKGPFEERQTNGFRLLDNGEDDQDRFEDFDDE